MTDAMQKRVKQLHECLTRMGGTHIPADIIQDIGDGTMQSFVEGDTWVVTAVVTYPRKKVLEVFLCVGDLDPSRALHDKIVAFARDEGCTLIRAYGRDGWSREARKHGWSEGQRIYLKEL